MTNISRYSLINNFFLKIPVVITSSLCFSSTLCHFLKIEKNIIFAGYQKYMRDYYEATDIVVLPSLTEGLPNVVLEAMSIGKPVIATNVGGVTEIIENNVNGWIVAESKEDLLAQKLLSVLSNRETLGLVGENGKASLYPKFSPSIRASKLLNIYKKLVT